VERYRRKCHTDHRDHDAGEGKANRPVTRLHALAIFTIVIRKNSRLRASSTMSIAQLRARRRRMSSGSKAATRSPHQPIDRERSKQGEQVENGILEGPPRWRVIGLADPA